MLTAGEVATLVGGALEGDATVVVGTVAPLDRAGPGDLTFLALPAYADRLAGCRASVVLVTPALRDTPGEVAARIVVERPPEAMLLVLPRLYVAPPRRPGIEATARLGRGVELGEDVSIGHYVVVGDGARIGDRARLDAHVVIGEGVEVGADAHLFPHVTAYAGTRIGARAVIHAGARLGTDGFGFVFADGAHRKVPHVGRCLIGDDVEIGANTTIDRGSIDDTVIGAGTKLDNLVHVAHNVRVGRLCLVAAQVGIAGSTHIGDGCVFGGQSGVTGHATVGAGARLGARGGAIGDIPAGETWSGFPARPHREALRAQAAANRLPELLRRLERLLSREGS